MTVIVTKWMAAAAGAGVAVGVVAAAVVGGATWFVYHEGQIFLYSAPKSPEVVLIP